MAKRAREATESGLLTHEEFEKLRTALINRLPPERKDLLEQLDQLFRLYRRGVLSEGGYDDRKWELLGRL